MQNKEKYKKGEYGFVPISKVVDEFMNDSFNDGRKYYTNFLKIAKRTWKKLFYMELGLTESVVVYINKSTNTAEIPPLTTSVIGISIVDDCKKLHALTTDDNLNIKEIPAPKGCGCKVCDCDNEVCSGSNPMDYFTEQVNIDGTDYPKVTARKLCANGDVIEEITESLPKGDGAGGFNIVTRKSQKYIGKVAVKPACNCVVNTAENKKVCVELCGCRCDHHHNQIPVGKNEHGHYKLDLDRGIIHLIGVKQPYIIVRKQGNGEVTDQEIMIPEYGIDCITSGMFYRSLRHRSNISGAQKREAHISYKMEVQDLIEFLNPIDPEGVRELQDHFMQW